MDEEVLKRKERPSVINLPPVLIEGPSRGVDKCRYECMDDGGCSVKFITRYRDGKKVCPIFRELFFRPYLYLFSFVGR